ncbi:MAG: metalloregulator ArsR/SmtB family transcription factor [Pseudomonadota bacterium]
MARSVAEVDEITRLLKVLAHPDRVQLIQLMARAGEIDVGSMAQELALPASRVSQHLSQLRAHRLVIESRQGRHRLYTLVQPGLASWLLDGNVLATAAVGLRIGASPLDTGEDPRPSDE